MSDAVRIVAFELGSAEKEAGPGARLIDLDGTADAIVRALAELTPAMIEAGVKALCDVYGSGPAADDLDSRALRAAFAAMLHAETRESMPQATTRGIVPRLSGQSWEVPPGGPTDEQIMGEPPEEQS